MDRQPNFLSQNAGEGEETETRRNVYPLFDLDPEIDLPNPKDEGLQAAFNKLQKLFEGKSTLQISAELQEKVHSLHDHINSGYLYGILTDPTSAPKYLNFLRMTVKDQYHLIADHLYALVSSPMFRKLNKVAKQQIVWLIDILFKDNFYSFQRIISALIRQISCCDLSQITILIASGVIKILLDYKEHIISQPSDLLLISVYSFLRLIPEHSSIPNLQKCEIEYVSFVMLRKFKDCMTIGRDLIRAFQDVSTIPEFASIWKKIQLFPHTLSQRFTGIQEILATPTPRWILRSRVTPEIESKLCWILFTVPKSLGPVFLNRFIAKFIKPAASELVYVDLIRFICTSIHPTNEILKSNVIHRWDAVLHLLKTIKNERVAQQVKLALFYDFLFWNPDLDNIMNIELSILLIEKAVKSLNDSDVHISETLVEFLYLIHKYYYPEHLPNISLNMNLAMKDIVSKGILKSVKLLYSPNINKKIKSLLNELFFPFTESPQENPSNEYIAERCYMAYISQKRDSTYENEYGPRLQNEGTGVSPAEPMQIEQGNLSQRLSQIVYESWNMQNFDPTRSELIDYIEKAKSQINDSAALVSSLSMILRMFYCLHESSTSGLLENVKGIFKGRGLPTVEDLFSMESTWDQTPYMCFLLTNYNIFTFLNSSGKFNLEIFTNIFNESSLILNSNLFLWVLRPFKRDDILLKMKFLDEFLSQIGQSRVEFIFDCLKTVQNNSTDLFYRAIECAYELFSNEIVGDVNILDLALKFMDPKNLLELTNKLERGNFRIFGSSSISNVLRYIYKSTSNKSEPEQTFLWRLFTSEFMDRPNEANEIASRILETGSSISVSAEAVFAFKTFLNSIVLTEKLVKYILITNYLDSPIIIYKWIKKTGPKSLEILENAAGSIEGDIRKEIIGPELSLHVKEIINQVKILLEQNLPKENS